MRVSAVILSLNSGGLLERAVRSLAKDLEGAPETDEIWIVDNGSSDGSPELAQRLEKELRGTVKTLLLPRNHGTTVARNLALKRSEGRFFLIMDADVEVPSGTVGRLIEVCDSDPGCGIVAPKIRYPSGRVQMSADVFPTLGRKVARLLALRAIERALPDFHEPRLVDYAISAFWLLRRETVLKVGYFDERIFYSPEDVDYCIRVWDAGFSVRMEPSVAVVHHAQELSRGLRFPHFSLSHARGLLYLFRKHRYLFGRRRLYNRIGRFEQSLK